MRRIATSCALATVAVLLLARPLATQGPRIAVDQRVELMAIVFKLAGSTEFNQNRFQPYIADIERHFGPHRTHPAIELAKAVRDSQGLYFSAVIALAVNVSNPPELRELVAFDAPREESRWRTAATSRLLGELRQFVIDTRADAFFASHEALYDSAGARLTRLVSDNADVDWAPNFFGVPAEQDFVVIPLLANSGTNFGSTVRTPGRRTVIYSVIGHVGTDSAGFPVYDPEVVGTLMHEVNHSYVNGLVNAYRAEFEPSASRVYPLVADAMRDQGYGSWPSMVYESIVDAAVARYYNAREGRSAMHAYIEAQRARNWLWLGELAELLGEYESNRTQYSSFRAFMPRVVAYFDSLPGRVEGMQKHYDAKRPRVLSISVANDADDVDPAVTEIAFRFDRPMRTTSHDIRAAPGGRDRLPQVSNQRFDSTGTVFRMGVALEPDTEYEFMLNRPSGGGFSSTEGIPLAQYRVRFKTRAKEPGPLP